MRFLTEASVNLADDAELLNLMSQAGFTSVFLGIETPNASSLEECQKHQNTRLDMAEAIRTIQARAWRSWAASSSASIAIGEHLRFAV